MRRWKERWDSIGSVWCLSVRWPWPWKPQLMGVQQNVPISGCVCVYECALCARRKNKTFKTYPAEQERITSFFFVLFFIWCYHSGVCSRFSLFSRGLTPKLSVLGSLRYTLHSFFLSFWSSWWSLKPPLLPFEHWNRHDKDLVQLLVSLLFLILSKQMESKQHL